MEERPLVTDNAIRVNGIINVPEEKDWEEFWDDFIMWLEDRDGGFFGVTEPIHREEEAEDVVEKILEDSGLKFEK
ncbi:hypothetical protein [Alkaliphilus transvaalensis]|uniref:hypothetical protein n=1 Tax=Alkaliphilus transvaalensis TaxID=114628 RepID=UPI0004792527|nr:hypothetical protein [Alkaliphilus transvaalensis]